MPSCCIGVASQEPLVDKNCWTRWPGWSYVSVNIPSVQAASCTASPKRHPVQNHLNDFTKNKNTQTRPPHSVEELSRGGKGLLVFQTAGKASRSRFTLSLPFKSAGMNGVFCRPEAKLQRPPFLVHQAITYEGVNMPAQCYTRRKAAIS